MSAALSITISDSAQARLAALDPKVMLPRLAKVIDEQNVLTVSHIQNKYLSFPRGGPATSEGLRHQHTPGFKSTLHASTATLSGDGITSGIGTNITNKGFSYPRLHEFGGTITRVQLAGSVRLRTNARGELLRQGKNGKLAIFAKAGHKRFQNVPFAGGKRTTVVYEARAPIQRGIRDRLPEYVAALGREIMQP